MDLRRAAGRLKSLGAHDALTILCHCLSAPRLLHILRSSECSGHPQLLSFDALLRESLCNVINTDLSDSQWLQACLPVVNGSLGIRSVASLAPSAFLASAVSTRELQDAILFHCTLPSDPAFDSYTL